MLQLLIVLVSVWPRDQLKIGQMFGTTTGNHVLVTQVMWPLNRFVMPWCIVCLLFALFAHLLVVCSHVPGLRTTSSSGPAWSCWTHAIHPVHHHSGRLLPPVCCTTGIDSIQQKGKKLSWLASLFCTYARALQVCLRLLQLPHTVCGMISGCACACYLARSLTVQSDVCAGCFG